MVRPNSRPSPRPNPLTRGLPQAARNLPLRIGAPTLNGVGRPHPPKAGTGGLLAATVDWGLYVEGRRTDEGDLSTACEMARSGKGFVWLGLHDPSIDQLAELGELFDLHELALEDAANQRQRPKIERYDESLFLALRTLAYVDRDERGDDDLDGGDIVETGTVVVFIGEYFAITVRHGRLASMRTLRRRLENNEQQLALGPSAVLHAVCDKVVDDYLMVVDQVSEDIEEIEVSVFSQRRIDNVERIYQLKRDIIEMKRTVSPLLSPLHELANRSQRMVHPDIREYFRDVEDHLIRVRDQVQSYDELLGSILQAGLARLTVSENEDMRKISAWVAIAAVPTMIAGMYGMNFEHIPLLHSEWGYPVVTLLMLTICGVLFRGFRRNGWL